MKKLTIGIVLLMCLLSGCRKKSEIITLETIITRPLDKIVQLDCYLGEGSCVSIYDSEHIKEIYNKLTGVEVDMANYEKNICIEDADMAFIFIDEKGNSIRANFCTSEYFVKDQLYYSVENRTLVSNACSMARDFYEMENEQ